MSTAAASETRRPLIHELTCRGFLSFGPDTPPLQLQTLNVLIGPNACGKSNLIEALAFLRATPLDLKEPLRKGGGVGEWIHKGDRSGAARVEAVLENPHGSQPLRHGVEFSVGGAAFHLEDEYVEDESPSAGQDRPFSFYQYRGGHPVIRSATDERHLRTEDFEPELSILAQRKDPETYPALTSLARAYGEIRIYREWTFGRQAALRQPQSADARNDRLEEDFSNLGLLLNRIRRKPAEKRRVLEGLRDLYEGIEDFDVIVEGGTVQVFFTEGDYTISATRLSDGTLRYLCLLAILCDSQPPRVICLEEPELGLHPDLIPKVAELLLQASMRTQLIVTTHSDILVDALTETPEAVVVCEKHQGCTSMRRLSAGDLQPWIAQYRLGAAWTKGDIGGTRW